MIQLIRNASGVYLGVRFFRTGVDALWVRSSHILIQFGNSPVKWIAITYKKTPLLLSQFTWTKKFVTKFFKFGTTKKPLRMGRRLHEDRSKKGTVQQHNSIRLGTK